jgi:murein DD-endopeptidase MepM/ murein hydrolase activator NlpD
VPAHNTKPGPRAHRWVVLTGATLLLLATLPTATPVAAATAPPGPGYTPAVKFRLPWVGGQMWQVSQDWHGVDNRNWYAYDFIPANVGAALHEPIVAAAAGTVVSMDPGNGRCMTGNTADNSWVIIDHHDGTFSEYVHLGDILVNTSTKKEVAQGQMIGRVNCLGKTVGATGIHLHFARLYDSDPRAAYVTYVSMKTAFVDERASGTQATPTQLSSQAWYASYNGTHLTDADDEPCSQNTTIAADDTRYGIPDPEFCARYYTGKTLGGLENLAGGSKPTTSSPGWTTTADRIRTGFSRIEPNLHHNWSGGFPEASYPAPTGDLNYRVYNDYFAANAPNFSARYTGRRVLFPDLWKFTVTVSDGVKLWVNNSLVINSWADRSSPVTVSGYYRTTTSGPHLIQVDYYNDGASPALDVGWTPCSKGC